jgi:Raf kinase inhibitor-like YbhB/YbcL family protein
MRRFAACLALVVCAGAGVARADPLAFAYAQTAAPDTLHVTVAGVKAGDLLDGQYSGYGRNLSPALSWTPGPPGTQAYALMWEDPDVPSMQPVVHWLAWNIPATVLSLSRGVRNAGELLRPPGMRQGRNSHGGIGYTGPHPPVGDPAHHYHVQVFALDRPLRLKPEADRGALLDALKGRVIARGEAVVLYAEAPPKPRRQ